MSVDEIFPFPYFKRKFDKEFIDIYSLGDIHWGHPSCLRKRVINIIDMIAGDENAFWVSHGDMMEHALRNSPGDPSRALPPDDEFDSLIKLFNPIAEKCLGWCDGNHGSGRARKVLSLNPDYRMPERLNIPYLSNIGIVNTILDKASYYLIITHSNSGAMTVAGKFLPAERLENIICNADIYIFGHNHQPGYIPITSGEIDKKRGYIKFNNRHMINGGHMLNYPEYAQSKNYRPSPPMLAKIRIHCGNGRNPRQVKVDFIDGK